jgi:MFS family permease
MVINRAHAEVYKYEFDLVPESAHPTEKRRPLTVLSYAIIADYFPIEIAARANGALNLLHFGWTLTVQYGIGLIVNLWTPEDGHCPAVAYQVAFGLSLALQAAATPWFRTVVRNLHLSPTWQNLEHGDQAGFAAVPVGDPIMVAHEGADW